MQGSMLKNVATVLLKLTNPQNGPLLNKEQAFQQRFASCVAFYQTVVEGTGAYSRFLFRRQSEDSAR